MASPPATTESRPRVAVAVACFLLATAGTALSASPTSWAGARLESAGRGQESSLPPGAFRFIGATGDTEPLAALGEENARLLLEFRGGATLDDLLSRGVAFDAQEILSLRSWGLLEQAELQFRAAFPVLVGDDARAFRERIRTSATELALAVGPAFAGLRDLMPGSGGARAFPAMVTWILRERAWHHVVTNGTVPIGELVAQQRQEFPGRGWWGAFWYISPQREPAIRLRTVRGESYAMHLVWRRDSPPVELIGLQGLARAAQMLAFINRSGEDIDDVELFGELVRLGMVEPDGRLPFPVQRWRTDRADRLTSAVERAARAVAGEFAILLQTGAGPSGRTSVAEAAATYFEMMPELLQALEARGLGVGLPAPDPGATGGDAATTGPTVSSVIWRDLPTAEPGYPLPWY